MSISWSKFPNDYFPADNFLSKIPQSRGLSLSIHFIPLISKNIAWYWCRRVLRTWYSAQIYSPWFNVKFCSYFLYSLFIKCLFNQILLNNVSWADRVWGGFNLVLFGFGFFSLFSITWMVFIWVLSIIFIIFLGCSTPRILPILRGGRKEESCLIGYGHGRCCWTYWFGYCVVSQCCPLFLSARSLSAPPLISGPHLLYCSWAGLPCWRAQLCFVNYCGSEVGCEGESQKYQCSW